MPDEDRAGAGNVDVVPEQQLRPNDLQQLKMPALQAEVQVQREEGLRGGLLPLRNEGVGQRGLPQREDLLQLAAAAEPAAGPPGGEGLSLHSATGLCAE